MGTSCRWFAWMLRHLLAPTLLFASAAVAGVPAILVDERLDGLPLVGHAELLRGSPTTGAIASPAQLPTTGWQPLTLADRYQGITGEHFWLRLRLHNPDTVQHHWVIAHDMAFTDYLSVFVGEHSPAIEVGDRQAFAARALPSTLPSVTRPIQPGETQQVYIRLGNQFGEDLRITLRAYSATNFVVAMQVYMVKQACFLGIVLALTMVWLIFGVILRQGVYISYAGYLLASVVAWASVRGLWVQFVTPETPYWANEGRNVMLILVLISSLEFTRRALQLGRASPPLDQLARWLIWLYSAVLVLGGLQLIPFSSFVLAIRIGIFLLALNAVFAFISWRRGIPDTQWVLIGWSIYGLSLFGMGLLPLLTSSNVTAMTRWLPVELTPANINQIAQLAEIFCFTISMALWVRTQQRERLTAEYSANTDGLTGLNNRKCVERRLSELMAQPTLPGRRWLGVIDIDFFKKVNDTYGHAAGDAVLRAFANVLRANSRQADIVGRFGGEEFILVLDNIDREGAERITNRLREAFEAEPTTFEGKTIAHTLSLGLAAQGSETELQPWFERADAALYAAKHGGRNRICVSDATSPHVQALANPA